MLKRLILTVAALLFVASPVYADITTNLERWYKFEDDGADSSGNSRTLTANGTPAYAAGQVGQCASNVTFANGFSFVPSELASDSSFTVSFWAKKSAFALNACPLGFGGNTSGTSVIIYPFDNFNGNGMRLAAVGNTVVDRNDSIPPANEWIFVVYRVENASSAKVDFYVPSTDDWYQNTSASDCTLPGTITLGRIGSYHNSNQSFGGDVDEMRFYSRALSDSDIIELMEYDGSPPSDEVYVSTIAVGANDGSSWSDAFTDPSDAVSALQSASTFGPATLYMDAPRDNPFRESFVFSSTDDITVVMDEGPSSETNGTNGQLADYTDEGGGVWSAAGITAEPVWVVHDLKQDDMAGTVTGVAVDLVDIVECSLRGFDANEARAWYNFLTETAGDADAPEDGEWGYDAGTDTLYVNPQGEPVEAVVEALTQYVPSSINGMTFTDCDRLNISGRGRWVLYPNIGSNSGYAIKIMDSHECVIRHQVCHLNGYHALGMAGNSLGGHLIDHCLSNTVYGDGTGLGNAFVFTLHNTAIDYEATGSNLVGFQRPFFGVIDSGTGKAPPLYLNWAALWMLSHATGTQSNFYGVSWTDGYFHDNTQAIEDFHGVDNTTTISPAAVAHQDGVVTDPFAFDGYPCQVERCHFRGRPVAKTGLQSFKDCVNNRDGEDPFHQRFYTANGGAPVGYFENHTIISGDSETSSGGGANLFDELGAGTSLTFAGDCRILIQTTGTNSAVFGLDSTDVTINASGLKVESGGQANHYMLRDVDGSVYADDFSGFESQGGNWYGTGMDGFAVDSAGANPRDFAWMQSNITGASRDWQTDFGWGDTNADKVEHVLDHVDRNIGAEVSPAVIFNSNQVIQ